MSFFEVVAAPLVASTLEKIDRTNVSLLGMLFRFSLLVDEVVDVGKLAKAWPFCLDKSMLMGCKSFEDIEQTANSVTHTGSDGYLHTIAASLRLGGRNRLNFTIDTRQEGSVPRPSVKQLKDFYASAHAHAEKLVGGPLCEFFQSAEPED